MLCFTAKDRDKDEDEVKEEKKNEC